MMRKEELIDSGGGWNPGKLEYKPIFIWPPRPIAFLKWLFHYPDGFIFPWAAVHIIITLISYVYFLPSFERFANFSIDWISIIFFRNFIILFVYTGLWHLLLHILRSQEDKFRYNLKPLGTGKKWLFNSQTKENMFWSLCCALPIWTAYESIMLWCYVNNYMLFPIHDWASNSIYFCLLFIAIPVIQHIHFYFIHRLIHWKPLYKWVHYLHHKNVNIGPWTGLSMHPVEQLLYLSTILLHFIIPSHPIHFIYQGMHTSLGAQKGHSGYERLIVNKKTGFSIPSAGYFHYLHHRYFECNYGELTSPLDKWFGTFHDGTKQAHNNIFKEKKIS